MNLGFGPMVGSAIPGMGMQPRKRSWQARLFDRMMPEQEGMFAVGEDDKKALVKQGLLQLGIGLLQNNQIGAGLGQGLQGGLLAMNQGVDDVGKRRYQKQLMEQQLAGPAGYREFQMQAQAAGLQPGSPEYQKAAKIALGMEGRAAGGGIGFQKVVGLDGKERMARTNPRNGALEIYDENTGDFVPMGGSIPGVMPPRASGVYIDPSLPPYVREQIAQAEQSGQPLPEVITDQPQQRVPAGNPMLGVSMSPQEKAFAEEQARQQAQLSALPQRALIEAQGAGLKAGAEATAKTQAEVDAKLGQKTRDAKATLTLLDEAEQILPSATGSGAGAGYDKTAAFFGQSTPGAQATAKLNLIAAQLVQKVPRFEGPQSDKDVQSYKDAAGNLADATVPVETRLAALRTMRALNLKYAGNGDQPADTSIQPKRLKFNPKTGRIE